MKIMKEAPFVSIFLVTVFSAVAGYVFFRKYLRNKLPKEWVPVGNVSALFIYPLKSGRRLEINSGDCGRTGLMTEKNAKMYQVRDRSFVLYNEVNGEFKTAMTCPKLVLVESFLYGSNHIVFKVANEKPLLVKIPNKISAKMVQITMYCQEKIYTLDCGDEAALWFSNYLLEKPSGFRLGYHDNSFNRDLSQAYSDKLFKVYDKLRNNAGGAYSNMTSYLLMNHASVEELKAKSPEVVTEYHYRPNIYVKGEEFPAFTEEDWDWFKIGNALFYNVKPCPRCAITTINPEDGIRSQKREAFKTLETLNTFKNPAHLAAEGKRPVMGVLLGLERPGKINVGDVVYVGKTSERF